jgi:small subunit ribosomal protein S17
MDKSAVVSVELKRWVNKYQRWHTYLRKYMAHDEHNMCNIGDVVRVEQLPVKLSARKAFNIIEILQREKIVVEADDGAAAAAHGELFQQRPAWAGLPRKAQKGIERARRAYQEYYEVTPQAERLAERLMATKSEPAPDAPARPARRARPLGEDVSSR